MEIHGPPLSERAHPHDLLRGLRDGRGDEVAVIGAERTMTWEELDAAAGALAAGYASLGLERGDRVASLMPNRLELVVHYLACFRSGLVTTPLNYRYTWREIDHALEVSGASALVVHAERADDVAASRLAGGVPRGIVAFAGDVPNAVGRLEDLVAAGGTFPAQAPDPSDPVVIFFTSGSTGPAKGVTHSHETLGWMIGSAAAALGLDAGDTFLPASSMSHVGSYLWTLSTLATGGRVIIVRSYDAHEVLPLLRTHRPTVMAMLPAALAALIRDHDVKHEDFASLRLCRAGSDKVSTELLSEFARVAGFAIDEGYGMTEVGLATLNPPSAIKQGSIGVPIPGFDVALRDDDGAEVDTDEVGRIWIRTRSCMTGYWNHPEATAEVMGDGWLDSGDLARADADGYLWFFGRKKQIIVHDGSNISPFEVEGALVEHPSVALAAVIGIHDDIHGENVRAYVTLRPDAPPTTAADLIAFCRERIGYKAPEEIVFLDEMPVNPTGKLDRVGLKRLAEEGLREHDPTA